MNDKNAFGAKIICIDALQINFTFTVTLRRNKGNDHQIFENEADELIR
jgi:hypothetical protein